MCEEESLVQGRSSFSSLEVAEDTEGTLDRLLPKQEGQSTSQELLALEGHSLLRAQPSPHRQALTRVGKEGTTSSNHGEESHSALVAHSWSNQQQDGGPACLAYCQQGLQCLLGKPPLQRELPAGMQADTIAGRIRERASSQGRMIRGGR